MYLSQFKYEIDRIKEVRMIGREFSAFGREYSAAGLVRYENHTELAILEYDETRDDSSVYEESEELTNRERLMLSASYKKGLFGLLKYVIIDDKECLISGASGSYLDEDRPDFVYILSELIKCGWSSESFFKFEPDKIHLISFELNGAVKGFGELDLKKPIKLTAFDEREDYSTSFRACLEVEKDIDYKIPVFNGEDEICIKRIHMLNLDGEDIDKRTADKLCPNGMKIPVVEYTAGEGMGVQFYLSSYLDSPEGKAGFLSDEDDGPTCYYISLSPDVHDEGFKYSTIQQAVSVDEKQLEIGFLRCSKLIKNPDKKEFLI